MKKRSYWRHIFMSVLVMALFMVVSPTSNAANNELTVRNVNQTLSGDITTSVQLNYHTSETKSSRDPQPETKVYYYKLGEVFNENSTPAIDATATKYSRTSYHKATITGLEPGQTYCYRIYDKVSRDISKEYQFTTKKEITEAFSFLAVADANYRSTSSYQNHFGNTLRAATATVPDAAFIVQTGKANSSLSNEDHWDGFFSQAGDIFEQYPIVPSTVSSGSSNRFFQLNYNLAYTSYNLNNYSFVYGDVLFLSMNSKLTSSGDIKNHISWLNNEVNTKGQNKWIVVSIGDSFYGTSSSSSSIKKQLSEAFSNNDVALVIQGDTDAYTRSVPVDKNVVLYDYAGDDTVATKDGVVYVSPGASGAEQKKGTTGRNWLKKASDFSSSADKKAADKKMYTKVAVSKEELKVTAYTAAGAVFDEVTINRLETPDRAPKELTFTALNNAFAGDSKTARSISWQADKTLTDACVEIVPAGLTFAAENITEYPGTTEKNSGIFTDKMTNKVRIDQLTPGVTYQYRLRNFYINKDTNSVTYHYSPVYDFTTESATKEDYTFLHMADSQGSSKSYDAYWGNTLRQSLAKYPETPFVIHTGDMVDSVSNTHYTNFFAATGNSLASAAFMPVLGNHEAKSQEKFYNAVFNVEAVNGFPLNYSYTYGNALFFNLNANYDNKENLAAQANWMKAEAQKPENQGKFIIVSFHKSPFGGRWTNQASGVLSSKNIKKYLVPEMEKMGVNLVLSGHDHNYIRSYPIKNSKENKAVEDLSRISTSEDGTIYMVTRNSGEKTYDLVSTKDKPWINVLWQPNLKTNLAENTMFAAITVTDDELKVSAQTLTDGPTGFTDNYTITK